MGPTRHDIDTSQTSTSQKETRMTNEQMTVDAAWEPRATDAMLRTLADRPITPAQKGFAGLVLATTPRELVDRGATLADPVFSTPLLVLRESAIDHNVKTLADYCARRGVVHAPHGKTAMSPELFSRQLAAGSWGLTAASVTQARAFADSGARRILIANEVTDPVAIGALSRMLDDVDGLEVYCYVDSERGIAALSEVFAGRDHSPALLVEVGVVGGRTGVRNADDAIALATSAVAQGLRIAGVSCFEGPVAHGGDGRAAVAELFRATRSIGERLHELGLLDPPASGGTLVFSAGGSHHFDLVADIFGDAAVPDPRIVVRSGSYIVHDHGTFVADSPSMRGADIEPFLPAIEVFATVLSRPEPGLALFDAGRRDVSFDAGMPVVLSARHGDGEPIETDGFAVYELNDQHGFLRVPHRSSLEVGDTLVLGISHPCTTFDKWTLAILADDDDRITGVAHTFF
jgi:D-serine dehydratase